MRKRVKTTPRNDRQGFGPHERRDGEERDQRDEQGRPGRQTSAREMQENDAADHAQDCIDREVDAGCLLPEEEVQQPAKEKHREPGSSVSVISRYLREFAAA